MELGVAADDREVLLDVGEVLAPPVEAPAVVRGGAGSLGTGTVIDGLGRDDLAGHLVHELDGPHLLERRRDGVVSPHVLEGVGALGANALPVNRDVLDAVAARRRDGVRLAASLQHEGVTVGADGAARARACADAPGDVDGEVPSGRGAARATEVRLGRGDMVRASAAYGKAHLLGDGLALERYVIPVLPDEGALHPVVEEGLGAGPVDLSAGTGLVVLARLDGHLHRAVRVGVGGNVVLACLDA